MSDNGVRPPTKPSTVYDYGFSVWPDEECPRWNMAARDLFNFLKCRVVMEFAEREFNDFREELAKVGLSLREIERSPHYEPETVL